MIADVTECSGEPVSWIIEPAAQAYLAQSANWDALNAATGDHILLGSHFLQPLLQTLAGRKVWLARETSASSPAAALLVRQHLGIWSTWQPAQLPLGPVLLADGARAEAQLDALLRALPGPSLLLGVTQQDPAYSRLPLDSASRQFERMDYIPTGRVRLAGDFEAYWRERPDDLRQSVARRRRRLAREGVQVQVRRLDQPGQMAAAMDDFSRMEQSGWKGAAGTSVGLDDAQGRFYRQLLVSLAERGEAAVYQLMFDERPVASQVCIGRGRMWVSLKIAYDEAFRRDAPGYLLQEQIIRALHQQPGVDLLEFYGRATEGWTRKWTNDLRMLVHLNVYRHPLLRVGMAATRRMLGRRQVQVAGEPGEAPVADVAATGPGAAG